jgi:selenocysteine lyase/cysteine desulfurase
MRAVLGWLESEGATPSHIHEHVISLQDRFLAGAPALGDLFVGETAQRGNFLSFRSDRAGDIYQQLHERGVITDFRGDRLRVGFGVYQDAEDVDRLLDVMATL